MSAPDPQHRYRIGFDHPFQPFAWLDGQTPRGTLIERVAAVMAQAGLAFDWVPMTLEETEPALYAGKVDALAFAVAHGRHAGLLAAFNEALQALQRNEPDEGPATGAGALRATGKSL